MPLEGIFIETSSTSTPDLSLQISPPSTSSPSSLICNNNNNTSSVGTNYEAHNSISGTNFPSQAHTELSLGRNFSGGGGGLEESPSLLSPPPHNNNNPYYQTQQAHFHHLHRHSNTSNASKPATTSTTSSSTHLNHINYGVSLLDVSSSEGLRPIKGIPVYHNRSFPFLPMEHSRDKDRHAKMCLYHHMPTYPSLSSSCSPLCSSSSPSSSSSPPAPYFAAAATAGNLDPMSYLNSGGSTVAAATAYRAAAATRFNGISGEAFKPHHHPLHHHHHHSSSHYGVGIGPSHETSSGLMRSRFLPKLPTKRSMRAPRMRWTSTLHARFVHAVELLGGHESKDN